MLELLITGGFTIMVLGGLLWYAINQSKKKAREELKNEVLQDENKILKEQLDNDVHSVDDANRVWDEWNTKK